MSIDNSIYRGGEDNIYAQVAISIIWYPLHCFVEML